MSASKNILIIMTGSIACYKVCTVISRLAQAGMKVQVVATPAALKFVGSATLEGLSGRPVISDMYASGNVMEHIHLMRWADLVLVAPATANFINKAAQGIGDDLVQTLFLAHDFKRPLLLAPAMNTQMYLHPATQKSREVLQKMGVTILETASGVLACGEEGWGRMLEPDLILNEALASLNVATPDASSNAALKPRKANRVLVTAGGTQEPLDSVRSISNTSTGKTGVQIAETLDSLGFAVTLIKSKNSRSSYLPDQKIFTDFQSLLVETENSLNSNEFDFVIHSAAVSDYSVDTIEIENRKLNPLELSKISSVSEKMSIHLKRNPKIVNQLQNYSGKKKLNIIAFKLTSKATGPERITAVQKLLTESGAAWVVHNDMAEINSAISQHRFTVYDQHLNSRICEGVEELCGHLGQLLIEEPL